MIREEERDAAKQAYDEAEAIYQQILVREQLDEFKVRSDPIHRVLPGINRMNAVTTSKRQSAPGWRASRVASLRSGERSYDR